MYRTVIVPLDGSEFSERALPEALAIARRSGAALRLVRVREPAPAYLFASAVVQPDGVLPPDPTLDAALASEDQGYLSTVADRLRREAVVAVEIEVLDGPVAAAIDEDARGQEGCLVVLATHGRGRIRRMWLGSVAHGVARHASVPVLLIGPAEDAPPPTADRLYRHVLMPLDGSTDADSIVPHAVAIGSLAGARYTLLQVLPPATLVGYALPRDGEAMSWAELEERAAERSLERRAALLRLQALDVKKRVVRHGSTAEAILEYARANGIDLIAMASHGHGWGHLILGDVADEVVRRSDVPVLHYHPPDR